MFSIFLNWGNQFFLGDEDSIQEFSLVLSSNLADLFDLSTGKRDKGKVISINNKLILDFSAKSNSSVSEHGDEFVLLSSQEVLNSDAGSILWNGNVDWEMSMYKSHLVAEALSDSNDHVTDE